MSFAIEELALALVVLAALVGFALGRWMGARAEQRRTKDEEPRTTLAPHPALSPSTTHDPRQTTQDAEALARRAVAIAMERCVGAVVAQGATSTIPLASEDLKGRMIGREGRNHRAFERAAGVDLIIEEEACAVTVSTLDPVRREVARRAIEALLAEGRIQPTRIEEVVARERAGLDAELPRLGAAAAAKAGVSGLAPPVLAGLGALQFRSSASQNALEHSIECALLAAHVASEIGADSAAARRAALLHDIGKGLGAEWEGPHALAGMRFLAAHGEGEAVQHAVGAHHRELEPSSDVASCVIVADAVSGGRPGARKGDVAAMLERVGAVEALARGFPGVEQAYAVQAGRDLRVIVRPGEVDDLAAASLAKQIARAAEEHPSFRGPVRVTVIRETRFDAEAR